MVCRPGNDDDRLFPMDCDVGRGFDAGSSQHIAIIWVRPTMVTRTDRLGSLCLGIASVRVQCVARTRVTTSHVTALDHRGKGLRLGFGYDDMVSASRNSLDGSNVPLAISDQMFVSTARCDKRFQFTLEIRW